MATELSAKDAVGLPPRLDGVAAEDPGQRSRAAQAGGGGAVVGLVLGGDAADRQRGLGHVAGDAARLADGVVGCVAAGQGDAGDGDRLAGADVLAVEVRGGSGAVDRDRVGTDHTGEGCVREVDDRGRRCVVGLVLADGAADRQPLRGDVGAGGGLGDGVVARIGAARGDPRHRDGGRAARILRGERTAGCAGVDQDGVATDDPVQGGGADVQDRRGAAVIGLVLGGDVADRQRLGGDRRGRRRLAQRVVAGIRTQQRKTRNRDRLADTDRLRRERARRARDVQRHRVATDHTAQRSIARIEARRHATVVLTARRRHPGHSQCLRRDVRRQSGRLEELILRRVGARDREARHRDGLVRPDRLARERPRRTGLHERHIVTADHTVHGRATHVQRRHRRPVVHLVLSRTRP